MKANAVPLLAIFEKKLRLEVPLFQRQYVWNREHQWEPLWEDISRKFTEYLDGRKDGPVHFLGAMVLDQKQTPTTHVEKRQVIDGQQRLTTFQIFLAAFRDFCRKQNCEDLAKECNSFALNTGMMSEPEVERFKVWPTQSDRPQFIDVITSGSPAELVKKYPLIYPKYARKPKPQPRIVEAYLFFHEQLSEFFIDTTSEPLLTGDCPLSSRMEECFQALKNALQVVVIDLDDDDDAQVIFETLNARGEPLLPADLLRNFIFLRAVRQGESPEALYDEYWRKFDDPFWREEIKQGRLLRPRSDLFMQHFLSSRQAVDIPITHLFVEYKFWIKKEQPFSNIREELDTIAKQGDDFRRIIEPKKNDPIYSLVKFLECFDIRTVYPLLLFLLDVKLSATEWNDVSIPIESYLLRRAVCSLTTKSYNRIFLMLTRSLRRDGPTSERVIKFLSDLKGESSEWPTDEAFGVAWQTGHAYKTLNNAKIIYILQRLSDSYLSNKAEHISIDSLLTVEHILPQNWIDNWFLPDGSKGLTLQELWLSEQGNSRAGATNRRNSMIHTFGNLTILTQALNTAVSNSHWDKKKQALLSSSLLPINQQLYEVATWNEGAIEQRSKELFNRAKSIWPAPH